MQSRLWNPWRAIALLAMTFSAVTFGCGGAEASADRVVVNYDAQIYQVLTNITGNGLISHTLAGINGWLQIIHQRLDDVELVMDGKTLTWNGQPAPDHPRIIRISNPSVSTCLGEPATLCVGQEICATQYMERKENNVFELKSNPDDLAGLTLGLHPTAIDSEKKLLDTALSFRYSWVKGREKMDGVNLEIGRPLMGRVTAEGPVQMRLGEWSCYQTPVDSEGYIFLFLRANVQNISPESDAGTDRKDADAPKADAGAAQSNPPYPVVEIHGSTQIRGVYSSGGNK